MADKIRKRLTNEVIISALLGAGSVKAAAQLLGVHPRTINSRSKSPEFKEMYAEARADLLREASAKLQNNISEAVDTLAGIMQDPNIAPQTRCNAATSILSYGVKYTETIDLLSRLEAVEESQRAADQWGVI